jgi:hypothetical protein
MMDNCPQPSCSAYHIKSSPQSPEFRFASTGSSDSQSMHYASPLAQEARTSKRGKHQTRPSLEMTFR